MNPNQAAIARIAQNQPTSPQPINPGVVNPMISTPTQQQPSIINPQVNIPGISDRPQPAPVAMATTQMGAQPQNTPQGSVDYTKLKKEGFSPTQIEGYLSSNPGIQLENAPDDWARTGPFSRGYRQIGPRSEIPGSHR